MVKKSLLIAVAGSLFLGGILAGYFATTAWPEPQHWFASRKSVETAVLDKLNSELRLTPAQTARMAPVIAAACSDLRLLSEERRASRLALLDEISATIAPELSADQQRRLEAVNAEWQNRPPARRDEHIVALF